MGSDASLDRSVLSFALGERTLALPLRLIEGFVRCRSARPTPASGHYPRSAIVFRGELIPLLELGILYGQSPRGTGMPSVAIVIRWDSNSDSGGLVACLVDQVIGVLPRNSNAVESLTAALLEGDESLQQASERWRH
jgi:chemotaxis signal transduction protein